MKSNELNNISEFLNHFRLLQEETSASICLNEKKSYLQLFKKIAPLIKIYEEDEILNAPDYNIFSILKINTQEPKVHTPFLYDLLKTNGEHKQGDVYFKLFIETLFQRSVNSEEIYLIKIEREKITSYGIIDLFITCYYKNNLFYLLIENKVYAGDGEKQLERYYNYLIKVVRPLQEQYRILYLTTQGTRPSIPFSISQELFDELSDSNTLLLISYNDDIASWINKCIEVTKPLSVQKIMIQYLITIKNL